MGLGAGLRKERRSWREEAPRAVGEGQVSLEGDSVADATADNWLGSWEQGHVSWLPGRHGKDLEE